MQVTRSAYYAWRRRKRDPGERHKREEVLLGQIRTFFERSKQTYGSPRILRDLRQAGFACGKHRVTRLMRRWGLRAVAAPRLRVTTDSKHALPAAENLLAQDLAAPTANRKWASDITYLGTD
jgi:transposase InsO family protein